MNLTIEKVTKHFKTKRVLDNISMELVQGNIYGLLGHNASGKSTLLKILAGYYTNWKGEIKLGDLNLKSSNRRFQKLTGYISETNPLYAHMKVYEYLKYTASFYRCDRATVDELIGVFSLGENRNALIRTLSKGYRQRVGLVACLIHNPQLLLLDEPTNGLDAQQWKTFEQLLVEFKTNRIILIATHTIQAVVSLCDHILVLKRGELVYNNSVNIKNIHFVFENYVES